MATVGAETESNALVSESSGTDNNDPAGEYVKVKVVNQEGNEVHFKVKLLTPMNKVMKSYADRIGVQHGLRFMFDGNRMKDMDTPKSLEMEDGDVIEVYQEQTGGGRCDQLKQF